MGIGDNSILSTGTIYDAFEGVGRRAVFPSFASDSSPSKRRRGLRRARAMMRSDA